MVFLSLSFFLGGILVSDGKGIASGQYLTFGKESFATLVAFDDFDPGRLGIYLPPQDEALGGRTGGSGRRGPEDTCQNAEVIMSVLAPNDSGWTSKAQPTIFWYFSGSTCSHPVQFTISNPEAMEEVLNTTLSQSTEPGIHRIDLAQFDVKLSPNTSYIWHISLVRQEKKGAKNIVSGGTLKYVPAPDSFVTRVSQHQGPQAVFDYAQVGYWYDAFTLLTDLVNSSPDNQLYRKQRICLIEQVGLSTIAQLLLEGEGFSKNGQFAITKCHQAPSDPLQN